MNPQENTSLETPTNPDFTDQFATLTTVSACLQKRDQLANSGRFAEIKQIIKSADPATKKKLGNELNILKTNLQRACDQRIQVLQKEAQTDTFQVYDPTFYSVRYKTKQGQLHPITQIVQEIVSIFEKLGFDVYDKQWLETQWYNYTSVNMPDYHPARGMQDAFYLREKDQNGEHFVLRTQVTSNAVRYAEEHKPPFRVIFPGLVFRKENIDATHDIHFTQFDMWLVDKQASTAQLLTLIQKFFSEFFQTDQIKLRLRPSYFPFTLPSMEGDISCPFCGGEGCRICKQTGWIEVFGAGPVHPEVIKNMGLNPQEWQGIAFGFGVTRLAQFKLGISGLSQFYNGNLEFLRGKDYSLVPKTNSPTPTISS
jgi:phenylalanyl-tRNA synthetase alpha chain